jgi:isopentenyl diphosphate isomerase/L-lactate dehydrogenase-like FMN-dependent dehydrogenase
MRLWDMKERSSTLTTTLVGLFAGVVGACLVVVATIRKSDEEIDADDPSSLSVLPPLSIVEFELEAKKKMSRIAKIYVNYNDGQGLTGQSARSFLGRIRLVPRILQGDLTHIDTSLQLFGKTYKLPVLVAPTAFHDTCCKEGEVATAKACARAGAGYCYNWMYSSKLYTSVVEHNQSLWLHMYMFQERDLVEACIRHAEKTGAFSAIILTCDHPHRRVQERMVPNFVALRGNAKDLPASEYVFPNQVAVGGAKVTLEQVASGEPILETTGTNSYKLSWTDVKWIMSLTLLPVIVKGVLSPSDAMQAVEAGAAAIVVSNHGGRQIDGTVSAMEVLPAVVRVVQGKVPVLVDSGIRTSNDVVKALCLGASGVLLGRPVLWALSCGGEEDLYRMLNHLRKDLENDMRSLGVRSIRNLDTTFFYPPDRKRIEQDTDLMVKE